MLKASPLADNILRADAVAAAIARITPPNGAKRRPAAVILPDYAARVSLLDFDSFPSAPEEQLALVRFRVKKTVPFDIDSAAVSYWAQPVEGKKVEVVVVMAPLEIVSRYESPFRTAGMNPGLITTSCLAALELAPEAGLSVLAKLSGRVLTVVVREKIQLKLVRCLELPSTEMADIAAVLVPTFVYIEDNLGRRAEKLLLCGFGAATSDAEIRFTEELGVEVEALRSPLGAPGENNAGLLGYLRSIARNN